MEKTCDYCWLYSILLLSLSIIFGTHHLCSFFVFMYIEGKSLKVKGTVCKL